MTTTVHEVRWPSLGFLGPSTYSLIVSHFKALLSFNLSTFLSGSDFAALRHAEMDDSLATANLLAHNGSDCSAI